MSKPVSVRQVLRALSSGDAVDWPATLVSTDPDGASRSMLEVLRQLDHISQAHRTLHGSRPGSGSSPVAPNGHQSVDERWGTMRLLEVLGRGAHGVVYRGVDERLNREVAVKLVRSDVRSGLVGRFLDEARLLARVRHPNVVTIHGAEVFDGQPGLWMERLDGCTLQELVTAGATRARRGRAAGR